MLASPLLPRLWLPACLGGLVVTGLPAQPVPVQPPPAADRVLAVMERVADWQLAHPSAHPTDDWTQAAGDAGFMALAGVSPSPRFLDAMVRMAEGNHWKLGPRPYHADDHCVGQTYVALFLRQRDPARLAPMVAQFDALLAHPKSGDLSFAPARADRTDRWSWCDSLFMAPPAWLRLTIATGNNAYRDFMVAHWWQTSDYLYDRDEHLYFRDDSYFSRREDNDRKVFWSRGNGWVMGGLVRVLADLPAAHPARPRFEQQYREMAAKILTLQQPDGFWHASLLDPASYPLPEASGTGFYCYAIAWGVNHGLLDPAQFTPAGLRAWAGLVGCVDADGKLTHVQPIGADPKNFDPTSTEIYGVGAFLLAGSEIYQLAGGAAPAQP